VHSLSTPKYAAAFANVRSPDWRRRERVERVLRWVRSCSICAAILPPVDVVCETCWERLARIKNSPDGPRSLLQGGYNFPVYSLFTWTPETDLLLRPLVHSLKKGWAPSAVDRFAEWFCFERSRAGKISANSVVPAPSSSFDHAKSWAEALGSRLERPIVDVLQKAPDQVRFQRTRSATERAELRFQLKTPGKEGQNAYRGPHLFVDDVITTGSTAMAAYMALGDPSHFEVWTMVNRPRLATK
jgi:predicted amidophosphoribosyltransferase